MANSIKNCKAPILPRKVWGRKKWCLRICPYAINAIDNRIPNAEKTVHTVTSGAMELHLRNGHGQAGFLCTDPGCSFFLGTATTPIPISIRNFTISGGQYIPDFKTELQIPCSGMRFWEF